MMCSCSWMMLLIVCITHKVHVLCLKFSSDTCVRGHEAERKNCFSKISCQKFRDKTISHQLNAIQLPLLWFSHFSLLVGYNI